MNNNNNKTERILLHIGLHKTGTSSLQKFFYVNEAKLPSDVVFWGARQIDPVPKLALAYSRSRKLEHFLQFRWRLRETLSSLPNAKNIIISSEDFCGIMPGRRGKNGKLRVRYGWESTILILATIRALKHNFPAARIELMITTRERESWIESLWAQRLHVSRETDSLAEFRQKLKNTPSPEAFAKKLRRRFPFRKTMIVPLEHHSGAEGPAAHILDWLNVDNELRERFQDVGKQNARLPLSYLNEILTLNREFEGPQSEYEKKRLEIIKAGYAHIRAQR